MKKTELSWVDRLKPYSDEVDELASMLARDFFTKKSLSWEELCQRLTPRQLDAVNQIRSLTPLDVGRPDAPKVSESQTEQPVDFVRLERRVSMTTSDGQPKTYEVVNLMPRHVHDHWMKMMEEMQADLGSSLDVASAYRSPAYQLLLMCYGLSGPPNVDVDWSDVARQRELPGYSQHNDPYHTAVDVALPSEAANGSLNEAFAETVEYAWMLDNAPKFGFSLSYPKDNPQGFVFEPWHWQYVGPVE